MYRAKVAIFHPQLIAGGGSEAVTVLAAEVLKKDYDVSLVAMGKIHLDELNKFYGTTLKEGEIELISLKIPIFLKKRFAALRSYRLARFCKKIAPDFDVMISMYNLMDFGKKGIQFIADFSFDDNLRRSFDPEAAKYKKWFYKKSFLRKCYLKLAAFLYGDQKDNFKNNITVANSKWAASALKKNYDINAQVLYPPAVGVPQDIPWDNKENGFVCLGRISPEKQIEKVIGILKRLRNDNMDVHLHIIGGADDQDYFKLIENLCVENSSWCFLEGKMYGQNKLDFIAKHKFGVSGRSNEPFGIAVAEMVKAGCIVFVPNGGGQTEIVNDAKLIYKDEEDAVVKIKKIINDIDSQKETRDQLSLNIKNFSEESFREGIKIVVDKFFEMNEKFKIRKVSNAWGWEDCSSLRNTPKTLCWLPKNTKDTYETTIYVDNYIKSQGFKDPSREKIGWLLETPQLNEKTTKYLVNNLEKTKKHFKYIFTCIDSLVALGAPFTYTISNAVPWIWPENRKIYNKTKLVSMIASNKGWLRGHQNRLEWVEKLKDKVDLFGSGRPNQLKDKEDGLRDYMFSVSIENDESDAYFTEKLTDNFATGTVPVYWGSKKAVEKYFDPSGVIFLKDDPTLLTLSAEKYQSMMPAIERNFKLAQDLPIAEDYFFEKYLKKMVNPLLVSIILPTYNREEYIKIAVESALNQSYKNIELIIIDDGSSDRTKDVISPYLADSRVRYIYQDNKGQAYAMNKGFKMAAGDIVCWIDSDDVYLPGTIKKIVEIFRKRPDVDVVFGDLLISDKNGKIIDYWKRLDFDMEALIYTGMVLTPGDTTFWRRSLYEKLNGFDTKYLRSYDYDFVIRMGLFGAKFYHTPNFLAIYRLHKHQLTKSTELCKLENDEIFKRYSDKNLGRISLKLKRIKILTKRTFYFMAKGDFVFVSRGILKRLGIIKIKSD